MTQLTPIVNSGLLYCNNFIVTYTGITSLSVTGGAARDSNNILDLININSSTTINASVNGVNGLDTGSLAASTFYFVYVIGDSTNTNPTQFIVSASNTGPVLPAGYDSYRLINHQLTNSSEHFIISYDSGKYENRTKWWDSEISVLSAGTATTLTNINLSAAVPASPFNNLPVYLSVSFTPESAGNSVIIGVYSTSSTSLPALSGVVASQPQIAPMKVMSTLNGIIPEILYKNSAGSCSTSISVYGYDYYI